MIIRPRALVLQKDVPLFSLTTHSFDYLNRSEHVWNGYLCDMKPTIQIQYRKLPRETFIDFEKAISQSITLEIDKDPGDHYEAPADIVILLNEQLTEIIVNGIAGILFTEIWMGLKALWKKILKRKKGAIIELSFKIKSDKTIEFNLSGSIDVKDVDTVMEQLLTYLKDNSRLQKDFANPDLKSSRDTKPRIRVRYNPETQKVEPVNYADLNKQNLELKRRFLEDLDA